MTIGQTELTEVIWIPTVINVLLLIFILLVVRPVYEYYWYRKLQKALLRSLDNYLEQYSQKLAKKVFDQVEILVARKLREGLQEWRPNHERDQ